MSQTHERRPGGTERRSGEVTAKQALSVQSSGDRRQGAPPLVARAVHVEPGDSTRVVVVACPYCQAEHRHRWPVGMPDVGPRIAPCSLRPPADMRRAYWVETSDGGNAR